MPNRAMLAVCGAVFVDLLGFTIVLPSLPFEVTRLGGDGLWLGALMSCYSLAQAVAAPALGRLSDRYGRRPVLLLGLAGSTVSLAWMGLASSLLALLAARFVAGLCGGSIGVAHAYAADLAEAGHRTRAMGQVGAAVGLGFTLGPAAGALLAQHGFAMVAFVAAGVAAANLGLAVMLLPPTRPAAAAPREPAEPSTNGYRPLLVAGAVSMAAFVAMETTMALLVDQRFGAGPVLVGWLLCGAGACLVVVQAVVVGRLARRRGDVAIAVLAAAAMAGCLLVLPVASLAVFVGAVLLLSAGHGLLTPTLASMLSRAGPAERRGARLGAGQSAASLGRLAGPVGAGALYDLGPGLPYLVAAALSLVAVAVLVAAARPDPTARARALGRAPGEVSP